MERKLQVFISSTYKDLVRERQKAVETILAAGHIPAGMELFHAGDETQKELIEEWIKNSDVYMLLLGGRYGSTDADGISYTEWEYRKAKELGKPIFALVLTEDYLNKKASEEHDPVKAIDYELSVPNYVAFKGAVMNLIIEEVGSLDAIRGAIYGSLRDVERKHGSKLKGWVSGDYAEKLNLAKKQIAGLTRKAMEKSEKIEELQSESTPLFVDKTIGSYHVDALIEKLQDINDGINTSLLAYLLDLEDDLQSGKADSDLTAHEQRGLRSLKGFGLVESYEREQGYRPPNIVNTSLYWRITDDGNKLLTYYSYGS